MSRPSYHPLLEPVINEPPIEDSEDLTDEEATSAIPTASAAELAHLISKEVRHLPDSPNTGGFTVRSHELRRRGEDLFWRTHLVCTEEPDKILVYRVNWIGGRHGDTS